MVVVVAATSVAIRRRHHSASWHELIVANVKAARVGESSACRGSVDATVTRVRRTQCQIISGTNKKTNKYIQKSIRKSSFVY